MNLKNLLRLTLLFAFFVFASGNALAADWYVNSTNGHDVTFDGTSAVTPFATIEKALSVAADGDVIHVAGGTYTEATVAMDLDVTFEVYEFQGTSTALLNNGFTVTADADVTFTGGVFELGTFTLTSGSLTTGSANLVMPTGATVNIVDGTISNTPTYEGLVDINCTPLDDYTLGAALPADLDGGTLTVDADPTYVVVTDRAFTADELVTSNTGTFELGADATLVGDLNNGVTSFDLGGNTLTWAPEAAIDGTGAENVVIGTIENGTVELSGGFAITGSVAAGVLPDFVIPAAYTSVFTASDDLTVDSFTLGADQAGAFTDGGNTLDVLGDFNRTDNTVGNFAATGLLLFSGDDPATFDPGANLTITDLEINKNAVAVTMDASVIVANDATITDGSLDLGDYNVIMTGALATFDNSGEFYSTTGNGYLAFENVGAPTTAYISGAGVFGNILVNFPNAASDLQTDDTPMEFSGTFWVNQGIFEVQVGDVFDFSDANVANPLIKINTTAANGATFANLGTVTRSEDVSVWYYGADDYVADAEWDEDPTNIFNVDIRVDATKTVDGPGAASTLSGALYVASGATLDPLGWDYTLDGDGMTHTIVGTIVDGSLIVTGDAAAVNGDADDLEAATIWDLEVNPGAAGTFSSMDLQSANDITNTTGTSAVNMNEEDAYVENLFVPGGTLTFDQGAGTIATNLEVTDGTLILADDLQVETDMVHGAAVDGDGTVDLNGFDLLLEGNYTHDGDAIFAPIAAGSTMANGDGRLIARATAGSVFDLQTDVVIPNLEIDANDGVTAPAADGKKSAGGTTVQLQNGDLEVSNAFYFTNGTFDLNARDFTITGNTFNWDIEIPPVFESSTGDSDLILEGDALVITPIDVLTDEVTPVPFDNDPSFETATNNLNVTVDSEGSVTFGTDGVDDYVYTFDGLFSQTAGDVAMGDNQLWLTNGFDRTAGAWSQGAADEDGWGFLVFDGGGFNSGVGFAVDNLWIETGTNNADDEPYTINNVLWLNSGTLTQNEEGNLTLADGAWIWRSGGDLAVSTVDDVFTWGATANLWYRYDEAGVTPGNLVQGLEWPADPATLMQTVMLDNGSAGANTLTMDGDRTINSVFSLYDGEMVLHDNNVLTLFEGANWELKEDGAIDTDDPQGSHEDGALSTTTYHLWYLEGTMTTDDQGEFPNSGPDILSLNITGTGTNVTLDDDKIVSGPVTLDCGAAGFLELDGNTLAVEGDFTVVTGFIDGGGTLSLAGAGPQALNVPAGGLNFPGAGDDAVLQIANTSMEGVTLVGGNLTMVHSVTQGNLLDFVSGTLNTGDNTVTLWHDDNGLVPIPGFTLNVAAGDYSHIVGNVRIYLDCTGALYGNAPLVALTRVTFPVGAAATSPGYYRPASVAFTAPLPSAGFFLTVNHVNSTPGGTEGLPVETTDFYGNPMKITMYPAFYWLVKSTLTMQPTVNYDLELAADGYTGYQADGIANVKLIRRMDGNDANPWVLQDGGTYDNSVDGTVPVVIVRNAIGALTTQGARFTYSIKSKLTAGAINDVVVHAPPVDWVFDLADWGVSGNAGTLTYDATTSNPAVATVAVVEGNLVVTPISAGFSTITVIATDVDGDFVSESFSFQYDPTTDIFDLTGVPTEYTLAQNYPNPFNPTTTLRFGLPNDANVVLRVFNVLGQEVATLINSQMSAGYHEVQFDATQLTSGLYIYRIEAGDFVSIKKMMLLK